MPRCLGYIHKYVKFENIQKFTAKSVLMSSKDFAHIIQSCCKVKALHFYDCVFTGYGKIIIDIDDDK